MKVLLIITIIGFVGLFFLAGCASSPQTPLYQAVASDRATVAATTTLYQSGKVAKTDAQNIYIGAVTAEAGLRTWQAALLVKDQTTINQASGAVNAALAALLDQLQAVQAKSPALLAQAKVARYKLPANAQISAGDVVTLVELAVELAPQIEQWVNTVFNVQNVTPAQVDQAFADLDAAIKQLAAVLNGGPTTNVVPSAPVQ